MSTRRPDQIRAEIEELRSELGETVEALTAKADVKAQARERVEEIKTGISEKTGDRVDPERVLAIAPLALAFAGALLVGYLIGRRRARDE